MKILITGGAGYIGSHTAAFLAEHGHQPILFDNLSRGHRDAIGDFPFVEGDIHDRTALQSTLERFDCQAVMHFAANIEVGESVEKPLDYYANNVSGTISLLQAMAEAKVRKLVFSSTAAVYGQPQQIPILEETPLSPTNPYGATKAAMESAMHWAASAGIIRYIALRYFNAAGAHPSGGMGEDHRPETHLIPLVLQVPLGKRQDIAIFGSDYDTPDGTCIRDYIHINDIAHAHLLALDHIESEAANSAFNLGNGRGYTVREVIHAARQVTGHPIPAREEERRTGDPPVLIASAQRAENILGWRPRYPELSTIIDHAWAWHSAHPDGYEN